MEYEFNYRYSPLSRGQHRENRWQAIQNSAGLAAVDYAAAALSMACSLRLSAASSYE